MTKTLTIEDNATVNQDLTTDANVTFATLSVNNSGLKISDGSHDLIIATAADLTADKTLSITTGDSNRGITLGGNLTTQNNNVIINAIGAERTISLNESLIIGVKNNKISYIGRNPAASPATGYAKRHLAQQREIIDKVFK